MEYTLNKFLLLLLLLTSFSVTQAQIQKGKLSKSDVITSKINPTEIHHYTIKLKKNKFAFLKLKQKNVDIKVTTYDPAGKKIEDLDNYSGKNTTELINIRSKKTGRYTVEVSLANEVKSSGKYKLSFESVKPKATTINEQIDEVLIQLESNDTPGVGVAIVKNGEVVYKRGLGLASLEYNIPIDSSTVFDIASVSKQFTGYAISFLIEQGEISLDDDVRKFIPELPDFGHTISIGHLVHHTSGLRDWPSTLPIKGQFFDDVISFDDILSMVYSQKELNFVPGSEFLYSNTGYNLLAELVQRITGESFRQWTETNIFKPLNMNDTHFHDDHNEVVKNKANGYYFKNGDYRISPNNLTGFGSSSLYTTIDDFIKWAINFHNPKPETESIINRMLQQGVVNNGEETSYAFGLGIGEYQGIKTIRHGGSWASFLTYSDYFPSENLSIIVFSNGGPLSPWAIRDKLTDLVLHDKLIVEPKKETINTAKPLEQLTLNQFPGNYELEHGVVLEITVKEESLHVLQTWNNSTYKLIKATGNTYEIPGDESLQFTFSNLKDGLTQQVTVSNDGEDDFWNRIEKFNASDVQIDEFTGKFYSEELSTTYNLVVVDNKLIAEHRRNKDFDLDPIKKDVFSGKTWYFRSVEFIRDTNDVITGFKVNNGTVRNLYFKKLNPNAG